MIVRVVTDDNVVYGIKQGDQIYECFLGSGGGDADEVDPPCKWDDPLITFVFSPPEPGMVYTTRNGIVDYFFPDVHAESIKPFIWTSTNNVLGPLPQEYLEILSRDGKEWLAPSVYFGPPPKPADQQRATILQRFAFDRRNYASKTTTSPPPRPKQLLDMPLLSLADKTLLRTFLLTGVGQEHQMNLRHCHHDYEVAFLSFSDEANRWLLETAWSDTGVAVISAKSRGQELEYRIRHKNAPPTVVSLPYNARLSDLNRIVETQFGPSFDLKFNSRTVNLFLSNKSVLDVLPPKAALILQDKALRNLVTQGFGAPPTPQQQRKPRLNLSDLSHDDDDDDDDDNYDDDEDDSDPEFVPPRTTSASRRIKRMRQFRSNMVPFFENKEGRVSFGFQSSTMSPVDAQTYVEEIYRPDASDLIVKEAAKFFKENIAEKKRRL